MDNDAIFNHDEYIAERRAKHGAYAGFILTAISILGLLIVIPKVFVEKAGATGYPQAVYITAIAIGMVILLAFCSWHLFRHKSWKSALALVFLLTLLVVSTYFTQGRPNTIMVIVLLFAIRGLVGAREYQKINTATMADTFD